MKKATVKDLQKAFDKAVKENSVQFKIEEYEFLTSYAKYFLQFLTSNHVPDNKVLSSFIVKKEE